jgi:hypothetical protein
VGVGSGALFGGWGNEEQSDITSKNNVQANCSQAIECHLLSENNSPLSAPHGGRGSGAAISRFNIPDASSSSGATGSTPTTGHLPYGLERAHQAVEWPGTRLLECAIRGTARHQ